MMKTKKSNKGLALVLAAVLALTPMAGFPITALATGEAAAPKTEAPATDAGDAPATDAGDTPQADAPATDADVTTDTTPGTTPSTPAPDAETPQAEAPATDATQPAVPAPTTSAASALTAPAAAVESAAASEEDVVIDDVNFPDPSFKKGYVSGMDTDKDGKLQLKERLAVTNISIYYGNIKTMKGIEFFPNLEYLYMEHGPLEDLDLSANKNLTTLTCHSNKLTNLDLSANEKLTYLNCSYTQITSLDLSHNVALTEVWCSNNPRYPDSALGLSSLKLPQSSTLTKLHCNSSKLTSLDVSSLPNLTELYCHDNQLTTLDLTNNTALTGLYCSNNQLTTLDLTNNTALTNLSCNNNQLTTLDLTGLNELGKESWMVTLSPQAPQIPVVKRGAQYELDLKTLAKGKPLTAIKLGSELGSEPPVDLTAYKKMRGAVPTFLQYVCETGALSTNVPTMEVAAAGFDLYHPATLVTDANGTLICDVASPMANELVLLDGTTPTFTAASAPGYQIATLKVGKDDIKVNEGATSQTLTLPPVTDAVSITATFKKIPAPPKPPTPSFNYYSVTPTVENGTITPEHSTTVREGNSLKYTFSPKEGYALESVSVNGNPVEATDESTTTTTKTYSYTINRIYSDKIIHVSFKAVEPPVDPTDPVDPPKPPVDPTDPVDPPKPPVDPADPINPPTPPAVPDNGGNNNGGNNGGGTTTIVERTNTVVAPVAPQAATLATPEAPATPATAATKTEAAPAQATADTATTQGQLENPTLGAQGFDTQHSHIPLALLLLAVWLVGGFAVIRQRKHTHDAIEGTSY